MTEPGPQKGPSSTARIEAQSKAALSMLRDLSSDTKLPGWSDEDYRHLPDDLYAVFDAAGHVPPEWQKSGWHFCCELDGALVNRRDVKAFCECFDNLPQNNGEQLRP